MRRWIGTLFTAMVHVREMEMLVQLLELGFGGGIMIPGL
jgi:hypothetical protein